MVGVELVPDKEAAFTEPAASNTELINKVFAKKWGVNKLVCKIIILV